MSDYTKSSWRCSVSMRTYNRAPLTWPNMKHTGPNYTPTSKRFTPTWTNGGTDRDCKLHRPQSITIGSEFRPLARSLSDSIAEFSASRRQVFRRSGVNRRNAWSKSVSRAAFGLARGVPRATMNGRIRDFVSAVDFERRMAASKEAGKAGMPCENSGSLAPPAHIR